LKDGWIKLHRKIRDSEIWEEKPFDKARAWIDLLLRANHKNNETLIGNIPVKIKAGQVLTSQIQLANDWGWSRYKVQCFLKLLEKLKQITIENKALKKAQRYTLLTITNWELYQTTNEKKSSKKSSKKAVKKQSKSTNKNVKNDKECKEINNNICPEKYKFSGQDKILALYLKYLIKNNKPDYKFSSNCIERWANEVRLMRERDKRDHDRIKKVMEFALNDDFWKYNILSMEKLRKQFDRLEMQMNKGKKKSFIDMELERIRKEKEAKK